MKGRAPRVGGKSEVRGSPLAGRRETLPAPARRSWWPHCLLHRPSKDCPQEPECKKKKSQRILGEDSSQTDSAQKSPIPGKCCNNPARTSKELTSSSSCPVCLHHCRTSGEGKRRRQKAKIQETTETKPKTTERQGAGSLAHDYTLKGWQLTATAPHPPSVSP